MANYVGNSNANGEKLHNNVEEETQDRISSLPDKILLHILSFLPAEDAFGTTKLSTSWLNLWPSLTTLQFQQKGNYFKLSNLVERTLILRHADSFIQKFSLHCYLNPRIYTWICAVIKHKVEHLDIFILDNEEMPQPPLELPRSLFYCETLVVLKLDGTIDFNFSFANPKKFISLPLLKTLHLNQVNFKDDTSASELFSSCPILEDLFICRKLHDGVKNLIVYAPKLKRFRLESFRDDVKIDVPYTVRVCAPSLEYLYMKDNISENIVFENSSPIVEAKLDVFGESHRPANGCGIEVIKLLRMISSVKRLHLSYNTFEAVDCLLTDLSYNTFEYLGAAKVDDLPTFPNLTHLELSVGLLGWQSIPKLLESTPNLKDLVVYSVSNLPISSDWRLPHVVPNCLLLCLKSIEIIGWRDQNIFKYLVKNARVLKKLKIGSIYPTP